MKTNVFFKDFKNIPHLNRFVVDLTTHALEKFERGQALNANILVSSGTTKRESHPTIFECLLVLHAPFLDKAIVIKKSSPDFYQSVRDSIHTAEDALGRRAKLRVRNRRKTTWHHEEHLSA
jgi:hypothetical protein